MPNHLTPPAAGVRFGWFDAQGVAVEWLVCSGVHAGSTPQALTTLRRYAGGDQPDRTRGRGRGRPLRPPLAISAAAKAVASGGRDRPHLSAEQHTPLLRWEGCEAC